MSGRSISVSVGELLLAIIVLPFAIPYYAGLFAYARWKNRR